MPEPSQKVPLDKQLAHSPAEFPKNLHSSTKATSTTWEKFYQYRGRLSLHLHQLLQQ